MCIGSRVQAAGLCRHTEDERRMGHLPRRAPPPATTPSTLTPHSRTGASRVLLPAELHPYTPISKNMCCSPSTLNEAVAPRPLHRLFPLPGMPFHIFSTWRNPAHSLRPRSRLRAGRELTYLPCANRAPQKVSTLSEPTVSQVPITEKALVAHFTDGETEALRH